MVLHMKTDMNPSKKHDRNSFLWLIVIVGAWLVFYIIVCLIPEERRTPNPPLEPEDVPAAVSALRIETQQLRSRVEALEKRQP
jgi:hypothetical protein